MKSTLLQIAAIRSGIMVFAENATKDAAAAENPTISTKVMLAPCSSFLEFSCLGRGMNLVGRAGLGKRPPSDWTVNRSLSPSLPIPGSWNETSESPSAPGLLPALQ
jgi:hypothetical protein